MSFFDRVADAAAEAAYDVDVALSTQMHRREHRKFKECKVRDSNLDEDSDVDDNRRGSFNTDAASLLPTSPPTASGISHQWPTLVPYTGSGTWSPYVCMNAFAISTPGPHCYYCGSK